MAAAAKPKRIAMCTGLLPVGIDADGVRLSIIVTRFYLAARANNFMAATILNRAPGLLFLKI